MRTAKPIGSPNVAKMLRVDMPDTSVWQVPASIIAENRAIYMTKKFPKEGDFQYFYNESMDDDLLIDWASNNMNWDEVDRVAELYQEPNVDFQEGWVNGNKEIVSLKQTDNQAYVNGIKGEHE